jgi:DNA-binding transcriptional LysR family regulator
MDRLLALRIFMAVADTGSFAAGARTVGLSAPSATRGVSALEAELGVRLFTRTTRQVRLTDVGKAYLQDVRDVLAQLKAADEVASGAAATPVGQLRMTCPQEFGRIYVAPILTDFLDRHPAVSADVLMVDRVVNLVDEGFDVALRIGPLPPSGLAALRVGRVRRVVCGAPAYFAAWGRPETLADLASHRIVSVAPLDAGRQWRFGPAGEQTVRVDPRLAVTSVAAAIDTVRRGWGIAQVLSYQIGPDLEAGTLETVLHADEPEPLPIHLVHVEGRRAAAKVRAFIDFAASRLRKSVVLNQVSDPGS